MKKELFVRSREGDYDTLQKRKAVVESKSPAELSQITNFSEIPLPSRIEEWLHSSHDRYVTINAAHRAKSLIRIVNIWTILYELMDSI